MAAIAGRGSGHSPANVTRFLKGIDFPAQKQDLVKQAQQNKAEKVVLDEIQKMEDGQYESMADVMKAYGKEGKEPQGRQVQGKKQPTQSKSSQKPQPHHK